MAKRGRKPKPKTQREISVSSKTPYTNPDTKQSLENPNDVASNRGNQTSMKGDPTKPYELGLKEIDESIFYYMENIIKPTVVQNGTVRKVPLIYGNAERWKQLQRDGYYRDKKGQLMLPLIAFKLSNIQNDRKTYNKLDANFPRNTQTFTTAYSKNNRYDHFNLLNNRKPENVNYNIVVPDSLILTYNFIISTYYMEQTNKIIEAINYSSNSYWGDPERFKFKSMIDSFSPNVSVPVGEERIVKSTFDLKLHGYIVPSTIQKASTTPTKEFTPATIKFGMEIVENL